MTGLSQKNCIPCKGGMPPLNAEEIKPLLEQLNDWRVIGNHHLEKTFIFTDFKRALNCVNQMGEIAEEQDHHPDIYLAWGKVKVEIWTHKINGLSESDFILAAKIDKIYET